MNPILEATLRYIQEDHEITRLTVDNRHQPRKVIFEFADGKRAEQAVDCDHQTFMGWWKHTGKFIRVMSCIKPLEDVDPDTEPSAAADQPRNRRFVGFQHRARVRRLLSLYVRLHGCVLDEALLPPAVIAKATLRGNEYAWPFTHVEEAVKTAQASGLATLGGPAQFWLPEGTCEMYWLDAGAVDRRDGETWSEFVKRSADEVLCRFREIAASADFLAEAQQWPFLRQKMETGTNILNYFYFVLYFQAEPDGTKRST